MPTNLSRDLCLVTWRRDRPLYCRRHSAAFRYSKRPQWFAYSPGYGSEVSYGKYHYKVTLARDLKLVYIGDRGSRLAMATYLTHEGISLEQLYGADYAGTNDEVIASMYDNAWGGGDNHGLASVVALVHNMLGMRVFDGWITSHEGFEDTDGLPDEVMLCQADNGLLRAERIDVPNRPQPVIVLSDSDSEHEMRLRI